MSTVDVTIARRAAAGEWPEDDVQRIVRYENAWGGVSYGLEFPGQVGKYSPSEFVRNPQVVWTKKGGLTNVPF